MSYQLKSIKKTVGREGVGFTATLHLDGKKIADVADYGDGGCIHIDYVNRDVRTEQEVALKNWHRANCIDDYSRGLESNEEHAINLLYSFHENDKQSKNAVLFQIGVDLSRFSDEEIAAYFRSGDIFNSETTEYRIKNVDTSDPVVMDKVFKHIIAEHPSARVWDSSTHRYKAINELVSA